jgi:4-hydroxybenzoate polyprenyltransferase
MVITTTSIISSIINLAFFMLSALPLRRSVKIVKGKTSYPKVLLIVFITGILVSGINLFFNNWSGILSFAALLFIYKKAFKLKKWKKAFYVWGLHLIFILISSFITNILLDIFSDFIPDFIPLQNSS